MRRWILLALAACLVALVFAASEAGAGTDHALWTNCNPDVQTAITDTHVNRRGQTICWEFDDTVTDSSSFLVTSETALICLDPDIAAAGAATAEVMPRRCHIGYKPVSNPTYQCEAILDASLDGTAGASGTQNMCRRVGPGVYYLDVTSANTGDKAAVVSIIGE